MPNQTRQHPDKVVDAIKRAAKGGAAAVAIRAQLESGALAYAGGPYQMSLSTVSYYVRQVRKEAKDPVRGVSPQVQGDALAAIDGAARQLLQFAVDQVAAIRAKGDEADPRRALDVAQLLKQCRELADHKPKVAKPKQQSKATDNQADGDEFARRLRAASTARDVTPQQPKAQKEGASDGALHDQEGPTNHELQHATNTEAQGRFMQTPGYHKPPGVRLWDGLTEHLE